MQRSLIRMPKLHKTFKGTLIADENANRIFVKIAHEEGWNVITITPNDKGIRLSDPQVAIRYSKGIHPIFTADTTAYKITEEERGKGGYIIHKNPSKEKLESYKLQIRNYFSSVTEKHTHNILWIIKPHGKPTKKKINSKRKKIMSKN